MHEFYIISANKNLVDFVTFICSHAPHMVNFTNPLAPRSENSHPCALEKGRKSAVFLIDLRFIGF